MSTNLLELSEKLETNNNISNYVEEGQRNFLQSNLGKVINQGLNIGIKTLLPDFIEDEVIQVKNAIITDGFKAGIDMVVDKTVSLGKEIIGLATGNFDNIPQISEAIKKGNLINEVSGILDNAINLAEDKNIINPTISEIVKTGKDILLNTVEETIQNNLSNQNNLIDNLNTYMQNWKNNFNNQNFVNMENEYNKISEILQQIVPLENLIVDARKIENVHNLIKNNGNNFNLSEEEILLAKKLIY